MANDGPRIQLLIQTRASEFDEVTELLHQYAEVVTVREIHPGPQANLDLFLPAVVELLMNFSAAHPFVGVLLGSISTALTAATAKKLAREAMDRLPDVLMDRALDQTIDLLEKLYKRGEKPKITFKRGQRITAAPPLRLSFELNQPKDDSKPTSLIMIYPAGLTDRQFRDACKLGGKVVEAGIKRSEERERYEAKALELLFKNQSEAENRFLEDEEYHKLRRPPSYAYVPNEGVWVDAGVLATQEEQANRAERIRGYIEDPPPELKGKEKELREMLAEIEKEFRDGRVE